MGYTFFAFHPIEHISSSLWTEHLCARSKRFTRRRTITSFKQFHLSKLGPFFGKAYLQAGSMQNAISGFRKCRIIPYNLTIFGAADFIPDNTGHKETTPAAPLASATTQVAAATTKVTTATNEFAVATFQISEATSEVAASTSQAGRTDIQSPKRRDASVSPFDIRSPLVLPEPSANARRGGKAAVIISSPYQKELKESLQNSARKNSQQARVKKCRLQIVLTIQEKSCETSTSIENGKGITTNKTKCKNKNVRRYQKLASSSDSSDEIVEFVSTDNENSADEECIYCAMPYRLDKSGEDWIRCTKCLRWVHELSAEIGKNAWKTLKCE
ncbi:hypothetical protein ANN_10661 [Periplaneta americana]|uniref:Uncharacterized protein n=1 Tax=Periplaneta americana TaxID=6978 RepID=A0ABQ8T2W0_PERAM|nr:hypothetical protein ANN_10661 [Periplaneta americana]